MSVLSLLSLAFLLTTTVKPPISHGMTLLALVSKEYLSQVLLEVLGFHEQSDQSLGLVQLLSVAAVLL